MYIVNDLKILLKNVKRKMLMIETEFEFINFFDNYKKDEDLSKIEEIMQNQVDMKITRFDKNSLFNKIYDIEYRNYINENPYYSAGIFFLPKNSKLPLHDHRNMLVFCKMLCGSAEIKSYDKIENKDLDTDNFDVQLTETKIYKEGDMNIVSPSNKNIHEITALENTAFFDILVPDYTEFNQCNYFDMKQIKNKIIMSKSKYF